MIKSVQSHPKAAPFCKKAFPLYDEIAELCEDVVATGANTFRPGHSSPSRGSTPDNSYIDPKLLQESEMSTRAASRASEEGGVRNEAQKRQLDSAAESDSVRINFMNLCLT
jgi:hypothetical protein